MTADEWLKQERIIPETIRVDLNRWAFSYAKCWQETRKAKYRVIAATGIILAPEDEKIRVLGVKRVYVDGSLKHYDSTPHTKFVERGNSDQVVYSYEGSRTVGRILKVQIKGQHWWKWRTLGCIYRETHDEDWCEIP